MSAGGIGKYDLNAGDQRPSKQELAEAQQAHERYDAGKDGSRALAGSVYVFDPVAAAGLHRRRDQSQTMATR